MQSTTASLEKQRVKEIGDATYRVVARPTVAVARLCRHPTSALVAPSKRLRPRVARCAATRRRARKPTTRTACLQPQLSAAALGTLPNLPAVPLRRRRGRERRRPVGRCASTAACQRRQSAAARRRRRAFVGRPLTTKCPAKAQCRPVRAIQKPDRRSGRAKWPN